MNIERIKAVLSKTYARIEQLQKRARDLEEQKKQAEDMEYLKIIRKHGISAEDLQLGAAVFLLRKWKLGFPKMEAGWM